MGLVSKNGVDIDRLATGCREKLFFRKMIEFRKAAMVFKTTSLDITLNRQLFK
jgi:hypothetical protein